MSGWMSWITGSSAAKSKDSTREAIVNLREHLLMLDKKEEYLGKKIDDEVRKARANATSNPRGQSGSISTRDDSDHPRAGGTPLRPACSCDPSRPGEEAGPDPLVPTVAKQALRQKKLYEQELESISGRKMTLTTQVRFGGVAGLFLRAVAHHRGPRTRSTRSNRPT